MIMTKNMWLFMLALIVAAGLLFGLPRVSEYLCDMNHVEHVEADSLDTPEVLSIPITPAPCLLKETEPTVVPYEYGGIDIHNERWRQKFVYKAASGHSSYEVTVPVRDLDEQARILTFVIEMEDDIRALEQDY